MKLNKLIKTIISGFIIVWTISLVQGAEKEKKDSLGKTDTPLTASFAASQTGSAGAPPLSPPLKRSVGSEKGAEMPKVLVPAPATQSAEILSIDTLKKFFPELDEARISEAWKKSENLDPKTVFMLVQAQGQLLISLKQTNDDKDKKIQALMADLSVVKETQSNIFARLGALIFDQKVQFKDYIATDKILWGMLAYSGFRFVLNTTIAYMAAPSNMFGFVLVFAVVNGLEGSLDALIRSYYVGTLASYLGTVAPLIPKPANESKK